MRYAMYFSATFSRISIIQLITAYDHWPLVHDLIVPSLKLWHFQKVQTKFKKEEDNGALNQLIISKITNFYFLKCPQPACNWLHLLTAPYSALQSLTASYIFLHLSIYLKHEIEQALRIRIRKQVLDIVDVLNYGPPLPIQLFTSFIQDLGTTL